MAQVRDKVWSALKLRTPAEKNLTHALGVEQIMRAMAQFLGQPPDEWGLAGLAHDIDIADTASDMARHGIVGAALVQSFGGSADVVYALKAHDDRTGFARKSALDRALYCADQGYWLVGAAGGGDMSMDAVIRRIQDLPAKTSVVRKLSEECPTAGLSFEKVVEFCVKGRRQTPASNLTPGG